MVHAPFGDLTDQQWCQKAETSSREFDGGKVALACDPAIGDNFRAGALGRFDMWGFWNAIRCPTLVLRGECSDLLLSEYADEMTRHGPQAELVANVGYLYAPALMDPEQKALIRD